MNKLLLLLSLLFTCTISAYSQAVGEWQTYFSYSSATQVAETKNRVFAVASGALFSCEKDGTDVQAYSKLNGLNDNNIVRIGYNEENNLLLIAYENANIDLLIDNQIVNIPDFMNKTMSGQKVINNISFHGDFAYLATGIGIVVVNIKKYEIKESYTIKSNDVVLPVTGVTILENEIFASTTGGVYKGDMNENLLDFNKWSLTSSSPVNGQKLVSFKGKVYLLAGTTVVYKFENNSWRSHLSVNGISNLVVSNERMLISTSNQIYDYSSESQYNLVSTSLSGIKDVTPSLSTNNSYWLAVGESGLNFITDGQTIYSNIVPNGPSSNYVYKQSLKDNLLYFIEGYDRNGVDSKVMKLDMSTNKWITIPGENNGRISDVVNLILHPTKDMFYVASFRNGLYEYENDVLKNIYSGTDGVSTLEVRSTDWTSVFSPAFDENNNLWLGNGGPGVTNGLKILRSDNTWDERFYSALAGKEFKDMLIMPNGQKWLIGTRNSSYCGVYVVDEEGRNRKFSSFTDQDGNLTETVLYYAIAKDKNNAIWIGTEKGILVFNNLSNVFDSNFTCSRIKIPRNDGSGLADYLLGSEQVNVIAVDGGNRKWIGTENSGLYLVSQDGLQTIHQFTMENSPLPSNTIMSLAIHPNTGVVFVGTDKGLLSYKSDAIEGKNDYSNVYVYPNPVKPDYSGWITVTGLMTNSTVKITDIAGELIAEGASQGGQYSWDGKNKYGERVATGVYIVYASDESGSEGVVAKIMMIK